MQKPKIERIGIIAKKNLNSNINLLLKLIQFLEKANKLVLLDENIAELINSKKSFPRHEIIKNSDLLITLGGDGTVLNAVHNMESKHALFLGVNLGNLGFLTEAKDLEELIPMLKEVFKSNYFIDKRALLRITIYRTGRKINTFLALNDAVINQGNLARIIELKVDIDRRKVADFRADGLVISTPTGSTGHSLSAGGSIVHPSLSTLLMTPICPVSLSSRPILLPNDKNIRVHIETMRTKSENQIALTVDGQIFFPLEYGDQINFRKSSRTLYFVRMQKEGYYKNLRSKIGWANY